VAFTPDQTVSSLVFWTFSQRVTRPTWALKHFNEWYDFAEIRDWQFNSICLLHQIAQFAFSALSTLFALLHCMLAVVQCIVISPVCVCGFLCGSVTTIIEIACIDSHQTGSVGEGSDHLQLIKFWPSCTSRKGVCGGAKIYGPVLLQPARSVCVSSERFFICCLCFAFLYVSVLYVRDFIIIIIIIKEELWGLLVREFLQAGCPSLVKHWKDENCILATSNSE